jgi:hypothetical protein
MGRLRNQARTKLDAKSTNPISLSKRNFATLLLQHCTIHLRPFDSNNTIANMSQFRSSQQQQTRVKKKEDDPDAFMRLVSRCVGSMRPC